MENELEITVNILDNATGESSSYTLEEFMQFLTESFALVGETVLSHREDIKALYELSLASGKAGLKIFELETRLGELTSRVSELEKG